MNNPSRKYQKWTYAKEPYGCLVCRGRPAVGYVFCQGHLDEYFATRKGVDYPEWAIKQRIALLLRHFTT